MRSLLIQIRVGEYNDSESIGEWGWWGVENCVQRKHSPLQNWQNWLSTELEFSATVDLHRRALDLRQFTPRVGQIVQIRVPITSSTFPELVAVEKIDHSSLNGHLDILLPC